MPQASSMHLTWTVMTSYSSNSEGFFDTIHYIPDEVVSRSTRNLFHLAESEFAIWSHQLAMNMDEASVLRRSRLRKRAGSIAVYEIYFSIVHHMIIAYTTIRRRTALPVCYPALVTTGARSLIVHSYDSSFTCVFALKFWSKMLNNFWPRISQPAEYEHEHFAALFATRFSSR